MAEKKYVSLSKLSAFLENLKGTFATLSHEHSMSDIKDYLVDDELSSTSNNPVANNVLDAEFNAISEAMTILESTIDDKAALTHASQHKSNGSDPLTPADIGAFPKSGGTINGSVIIESNSTIKGNIILKKAENGYANISKNHSDSNDYGTQLQDFSADGDRIALQLRANSQVVNLVTEVDGVTDTKEILHTGNKNLITPSDIGAYDVATIGVAIESGANLNDYTTAGVYRSSGSNISATLANCPVTDAGFRLIVESGYGTNSCIQHIYYGIRGREYLRALSNGTWNDWVEYAVKNEHYTKTEVDDLFDSFEFITVEDIDTICNTTIQIASLSNEVSF